MKVGIVTPIPDVIYHPQPTEKEEADNNAGSSHDSNVKTQPCNSNKDNDDNSENSDNDDNAEKTDNAEVYLAKLNKENFDKSATRQEQVLKDEKEHVESDWRDVINIGEAYQAYR